MTRHLFSFTLVAMLMLCFAMDTIQAQTIEYEYHVVKQDKNKKETPEPVNYGLFNNPDKGMRIYQDALKEKKQQGDYGSIKEPEILNKLELTGSAPTGVFTSVALSNAVLVILTSDEELFMIPHDNRNYTEKPLSGCKVSCREIEKNAKYEYYIYIMADIQIDEVLKEGRMKRGGSRRRSFDYEDGKEHWEYHLEIPKVATMKSSRITLIPYAVNCQTEDTVEYLPPAVYEGSDYHRLQDKRKAFNYEKLDPLGRDRVDIIRRVKVDTIKNGRTYYRTVTDYQLDAKGDTVRDEFGPIAIGTRQVEEHEDSFAMHSWIDTLKTCGYMGPLEEQLEIIIGRDDKKGRIDIVVDGNLEKTCCEEGEVPTSVSRSHVLLRPVTEGGYRIWNINKGNRTYVNGDTIRKGTYEIVDKGDKIELGKDRFKFDWTWIEDMSRRNIVVIDTIIDYDKPDKNMSYKGVLKYALEDYHSVRYDTIDPGSCLRIAPYKFLEMSAAVANIPLNAEFYENAMEIPTNVTNDLEIKFRYNSADTISESVDWAKIQTIEREIVRILDSEGVVTPPVLTAYASPDGSVEYNRNLARRRAEAASRLISLPAKIQSQVKIQPEIDTWENTANLLEQEGNTELAQKVREVLATNRNPNSMLIRSKVGTDAYTDIVKPVLEKQCRITFQYAFISKKKMSPQEAVSAYYADKYKFYSNGDYYNMFEGIKDSLELDTLTDIAYQQVIVRNQAFDKPFAPYIINRKAILEMRRGKADSTILQPLIFETRDAVKLGAYKQNQLGIRIKCNRPEIILNQAVIFYQMQEPERAKFYLDELKRQGYNSPSMEKLRSYINFKELYKIAEEQRSIRQQQDFDQALSLIESSSPDNRAVLYTEFEGLGKRALAWKEVHMMDNDNPKKWYLMGLLWATGSRRESDFPLPADSVTKEIKDIPYYLAYFQKSFDLERDRLKKTGVQEDLLNVRNAYMKYYFNEGYIDEEMRKKYKHAYKNERVPAYRRLFMLRQEADEKERQLYIEAEKKTE